MMFQGTYTSEFYRAIRDLIHKQVALQVLENDVPTPSATALRALGRRWHRLLSRERLYRSPARDTSGVVMGCATRAVGSSTEAARGRSVD